MDQPHEIHVMHQVFGARIKDLEDLLHFVLSNPQVLVEDVCEGDRVDDTNSIFVVLFEDLGQLDVLLEDLLADFSHNLLYTSNLLFTALQDQCLFVWVVVFLVEQLLQVIKCFWRFQDVGLRLLEVVTRSAMEVCCRLFLCKALD